MRTENVSWRGTPGVGDFMWALNSCHAYAKQQNVKIRLEMHWEHGEDYYHHFEDPETIVERMDYIHNFYVDKDRVQVVHVFNSDGRYTDWKYDDDIVIEEDGSKRVSARSGNQPKNRFWFESGAYDDLDGTPVPDNNYIFRRSAFQPTNRKRIVVWTPIMNAEAPRTWKRMFTARDWGMLMTELRQNGFEVHEITYRTPVREAMYLISTARVCISYDGMWHYVAKNFARPTVVISPEGVTLYHTPNAIRCHPLDTYDLNIWWWMDHFSDLLGHSKQKALKYEQDMRIRYGNE